MEQKTSLLSEEQLYNFQWHIYKLVLYFSHV